MPLFDHFHAPLRKRRHWESFHSSWTPFIARQLNKKPLPAGFVAEPHVTLGLDVCEVRVYDDDMARTLVAAVEVVSPANKDRPGHRRAFVAKCAAYLQQNVSLVLVDVVTNRHCNLYAELAEFLDVAKPARTAVSSHLYAVACRVIRQRKRTQLEVWPAALQVGAPLPVLPLWLTREIVVPLDLESSYNFTCDSLSIPA